MRPGSIPRAEIDKKYVLKSGMLKMKSNKIGKAAWKDKWFVLRPDSLCYYKSAVVRVGENLDDAAAAAGDA